MVVLPAGVLGDTFHVLDDTLGRGFPVLVVVAEEPGVLFGHLDVAATPTDDLLGELVHGAKAAGLDPRFAVRLADVLDHLARELAVLVVEAAGVELAVVQLFRHRLELGIGRRLDARLLDGVACGNVAVPLHVEDGDRGDPLDDGGIDAVALHPLVVRLRLLEGEVVVGGVGGHRHDDAGGVVGVHEPCG